MRPAGGVDLKETAARHREHPERRGLAQPGEVFRRSVAPVLNAVVFGVAEGDVHPLVQRAEEPLVGAQLGQLGIDLRAGERALSDVGHRRIVVHHIAEEGFALHFVGVEHDLVAVAELRLRRERRADNGTVVNKSGRVHHAEQLVELEFGFIGVVGVKVAAAGAASEIGAGRFDPVRAFETEADDFGAGEVLLLRRDPADQFFARQRLRDKNHFPVHTGQPVAAHRTGFDLTLEFGSGPHITPALVLLFDA